MEKMKLNRHDVVFLTNMGNRALQYQLPLIYNGIKLEMMKTFFLEVIDVPCIVRRGRVKNNRIPVGIVHPKRIAENRLRAAMDISRDEIRVVVRPYEVIRNLKLPRNKCMEAILNIYHMAKAMDVQIGAFGSVALEIMTGLPYTDQNSDLDILIKPTGREKLQFFFQKACEMYPKVQMDFEMELPNGYGVKLNEVFMDTTTLLGKSCENVSLLKREDVVKFLK